MGAPQHAAAGSADAQQRPRLRRGAPGDAGRSASGPASCAPVHGDLPRAALWERPPVRAPTPAAASPGKQPGDVCTAVPCACSTAADGTGGPGSIGPPCGEGPGGAGVARGGQVSPGRSATADAAGSHCAGAPRSEHSRAGLPGAGCARRASSSRRSIGTTAAIWQEQHVLRAPRGGALPPGLHARAARWWLRAVPLLGPGGLRHRRPFRGVAAGQPPRWSLRWSALRRPDARRLPPGAAAAGRPSGRLDAVRHAATGGVH
mmetsp:Transcript_42633/g.132657  ORF Transcript_42633/g.132657 Transcript_42633/m.132657 type:complete len:261 (+) Transcript_42633:1780-2562(+)